MSRERLPDRRAAETFNVRPGYDPSDDMCRSIEFAYAFIRALVARRGLGWCEWPEPVALDAAGTCARPPSRAGG
jgi:hypothetical protein